MDPQNCVNEEKSNLGILVVTWMDAKSKNVDQSNFRFWLFLHLFILELCDFCHFVRISIYGFEYFVHLCIFVPLGYFKSPPDLLVQQSFPRTFPKLSQDFLRTFSWLSQDFLRTFLGLFQAFSEFSELFLDFLRTFSELSQDFLRTFSGLSQVFLRTVSRLSQDLLRTFSGLSEDFLRTFQELSNDFHRTFTSTFSELFMTFKFLDKFNCFKTILDHFV